MVVAPKAARPNDHQRKFVKPPPIARKRRRSLGLKKNREPARPRRALHDRFPTSLAPLNAHIVSDQMGESPIAAVPPEKRRTQTSMPDGVEESLERTKALCGHHTFSGSRWRRNAQSPARSSIQTERCEEANLRLPCN